MIAAALVTAGLLAAALVTAGLLTAGLLTAALIAAALLAAGLIAAALVTPAAVTAGLLSGGLIAAARRLLVTAPVPAPTVAALRLAWRGLVPEPGWPSSRAPCGAPPVSWAPACWVSWLGSAAGRGLLG